MLSRCKIICHRLRIQDVYAHWPNFSVLKIIGVSKFRMWSFQQIIFSQYYFEACFKWHSFIPNHLINNTLENHFYATKQLMFIHIRGVSLNLIITNNEITFGNSFRLSHINHRKEFMADNCCCCCCIPRMCSQLFH